MNFKKSAFIITVLLAFLVFNHMANASLITEYRLVVCSYSESGCTENFYTAPATLSSSEAEAWATTSSLYSYGYNNYYEEFDEWNSGSAWAELRIFPDTLTDFQISFDYQIDSGSYGLGSTAWVQLNTTIWQDQVSNNSGLKTGSYTYTVRGGEGDMLCLGVSVFASEGEGYYELARIDNISITASPVPLPTSALLLFSGVMGLVGIRRKYLK